MLLNNFLKGSEAVISRESFYQVVSPIRNSIYSNFIREKYFQFSILHTSANFPSLPLMNQYVMNLKRVIKLVNWTCIVEAGFIQD